MVGSVLCLRLRRLRNTEPTMDWCQSSIRTKMDGLFLVEDGWPLLVSVCVLYTGEGNNNAKDSTSNCYSKHIISLYDYDYYII